MGKWILLAALGGLAWFLFVDGSKLDEEKVRGFYEDQHEATLAMDADAMCGQLSSDLSGRITTYVGPHQQVELVSKAEVCDELEESMEQMKRLVAALGDRAPFNASYEINKITLSDDRKSATVEVRSVLEMAGARFVSRSVETLVRRHRVVLNSHVEARMWVSESSSM